MKYFFVLIFLIFCFNVNGANYYFSTTGNDETGNGSMQRPWKSLYKLSMVMATKNEGDSFLLKRGDTFYGTVIITRSGSENKPIVLSAYGTGNMPVITGLINLVNWKNIGKNLFEHAMPEGFNGNLNMVVQKDNIQPVGRYPKAGNGNDSYFYIKSHKGSSVLESRDINSIPHFEGGELVQRKMQWIFDRSVITEQKGAILSTVPKTAPDHPTITYESMDGHGFFFQNHINTLTQKGDWSYNASTRKLTMFNGNSSPVAVSVAGLNSLLNIENKRYITINDIYFKGANENLVNLKTAAFIILKNCTFEFAGINAIDVDRITAYATHHNTLINCTINNTNNNALNLVESTFWTIANNHINNTGLIQGMGLSGDGQYVAIFKAGANSVIENNEIENTGYNAVWFTGDNTIVRNNYIHHYLLVKSDGGGIYTYRENTQVKNRLIENNIIHDGVGDRFGMGEKENPYTGQVHGIYIDAYGQGVQIRGNTSFNNAHAGLFLGSCNNVTVTGNTFINNKVAQIKGIDDQEPLQKITISNNLLVAKDRGSLILSFNVSPASIAQISIDKNIYSRPIYEPEHIKAAKGYSSVPFNWDNYHDGGTIETGNSFYSLEFWKKEFKKDISTIKPKRVNGYSFIRFEFNPTNEPIKIQLTNDFTDLEGNKVSGSITIAPFASKVLLSKFNTPLQAGSLQLKKKG